MNCGITDFCPLGQSVIQKRIQHYNMVSYANPEEHSWSKKNEVECLPVIAVAI